MNLTIINLQSRPGRYYRKGGDSDETLIKGLSNIYMGLMKEIFKIVVVPSHEKKKQRSGRDLWQPIS